MNMNHISKKLNEAGNKAHALGKATLKHPITTALSLCTLIAVATNLVSYSQTTKPTVTQEKITGTMLNWENLIATEKAKKFPIQDIKITNKKGKTIKGDVLSVTRTHIVFLIEEKEYKIKESTLSKKSIREINKKRKLSPKKSVTERKRKLPAPDLNYPGHITLSLKKQADPLPLHNIQIIGTDNNAITGDILDIVDENDKTTEPFDATISGITGRPKKQNLTYHHIIFQKDGKKYKINWNQLSQKTTDAIKTARTFSLNSSQKMSEYQIATQKNLPKLRQKLVETKNRKTKNKTEEKIKKLEIEQIILRIKYDEECISTPLNFLHKAKPDPLKIPINELIKKMRDPKDPIHALTRDRSYYLSYKIKGLKQEPNRNNKYIIDILPTLKVAIPIKDDKGYSMNTKLFPEIKFKVKKNLNTKYYLYQRYTAHYLLQILCKRKGIPAPDIKIMENYTGPYGQLKALYPNIKITIQHYKHYTTRDLISFEFIKQQLRKNIPIIIHTDDGRNHLKGIAVGYHYADNNQLIIHFLDINQNPEKNIKEIPATEISVFGKSFHIN